MNTSKGGTSVHLVPNFHPASCGWLANWSVERNHCANTYLAHLDRVASDPSYRFVLSEVNNLIAILNFTPDRFSELRQRVLEGRVEAVNAFFLEATMSLGGGEVYARMGVDGMRWQEHMLGVRPRHAWCIDICGTPDQMAQIAEQLGLESLVFTRNNRREQDSNCFIGVSPDGSRIPVVAPTHYSDFGTKGLCHLFAETAPLSPVQISELREYFEVRAKATPPDAPVLILAGKGDYSTPPLNPGQPAEFVRNWNDNTQDMKVRISTFSEFFQALQPLLGSLPELPVSTPYTWNAFWVQNPRVKARFRRSEHALQCAEIAATLASLAHPSSFSYPSQDLHHAWLQLFLNADRNTLWGAAGGMVFEHESSWDASDRFNWIASNTERIVRDAHRALGSNPRSASLFNALNWDRNDPVDGLYQAPIPALGFAPAPVAAQALPLPVVPEQIETEFYRARIDVSTGELVSLRSLPSGTELIRGPANRIVAERAVRPEWYAAGDNLLLRSERPRLAASHETPATIEAFENAIALTLTLRSRFLGGGECVRTVRFNKHYPRIDFETQLNDLPDETVVLVEFPLAEPPFQIRRGVPFGFSHGSWPEGKDGLDGITEGILPGIRWSDYELSCGRGVALLDRGIPAREFTGNTACLLLLNTVSRYYGYPNPWLAGAGAHSFSYALAVRDQPWNEANIARLGWEFNQPPLPCAGGVTQQPHALSTSRNLIVEALRREDSEVELRAIECLGVQGEAWIELGFAFSEAFLTDFHGERRVSLGADRRFHFPVRAQQIVTIRLRTHTKVAPTEPLLDWSVLVPESKRPALRTHLPRAVGHPPRGD